MRHIVILIGASIISIIAFSQTYSTYSLEKASPDFAQPPLTYIPDSIKESLVNKNFIFYDIGYHGFSSSMIIQDSCQLLFRQWTTKTRKDCEDAPFDTTSLIQSNRQIIEWGLDSLVKEAQFLKPIFHKHDDGDGWFPHPYTTLYAYSIENGVFYLHTNELVEFDGINDSSFNANIEKLKQLMYWISIPDIRRYYSTVGTHPGASACKSAPCIADAPGCVPTLRRFPPFGDKRGYLYY